MLTSLGWQKQWRVESPAKWKRAVELVHLMLSRAVSPGQVPIVKTHNNSLALAGDLLEPQLAAPPCTALFLYSAFEDYLASILKDEERREGARRFLAGDTVLGMENMPSELTDAQAAALCWMAHIAAHKRLVEENGALRFLALQDQVFYQRPGAALRAVSELLDLGLGAHECIDIAGGAVFTTHSKSGQPYSNQLRQMEQQQLRTQFCSEISEVRKWLATQPSLAPYCDWPPPEAHLEVG